MDSISHDVYTTYLDTVGRPAVTLARKRCSEKHAQLIYVSVCAVFPTHLTQSTDIDTICNDSFRAVSIIFFSNDQVRYTLTPTAHLRKPLAIMTVCMALFGLAFVVRRFDPRIKA